MYLAKIKSFLARCLFKFFIDGNLKAFGVIMEETVRKLSTRYYLVGWSSTMQIGICYMISPFAGLLHGTLSFQALAFVGATAVGVGSLSTAITQSMWQNFISVSVSGCGFGLLNIVTILSLKDTFRGSYDMAYSVTQFATYAGISVLPPLLEYLLQAFEHQVAMAIFGGLSLSVLLIPVLVPDERKVDSKEDDEDVKNGGNHGAREPPKDSGQRDKEDNRLITNGKENGEEGILSLIKFHPTIILLVFMDSTFRFGFTSWSIFLVPYGEYYGLDSSTAVLLSTFGGIGGIGGRAFGVLLCHFQWSNVITGMAFPSGLMALVYATSLFYNSFTVLALVGFLGGFGNALLGNTTLAFMPCVVCDRHFKAAVVLLFTAAGIASQLGGAVTGGIIDVTGSYRIAFATLTAIAAVQCAVAILWRVCCTTSKPQEADCQT